MRLFPERHKHPEANHYTATPYIALPHLGNIPVTFPLFYRVKQTDGGRSYANKYAPYIY
jgi:hypothetical protein